MSSRLLLEKVRRDRHQLVLPYRVDGLLFHTDYWYDSVNFFELEQRYGQPFMDRVYFHLLAYEANKAASLAPAVFDPGPYAEYCTPAFATLWTTMFENVWGVWRHRNDRPDYRTPEVLTSEGKPAPAHIPPGPTELLCLCGGGKDSLVMMQSLEAVDVPYDSFVYSHNIYGKAAPQHQMISDLLNHCQPRVRHRGWVYDTTQDSPAPLVYPEYKVQSMLSAETVSSYWTALPLALAHGHHQVALGITRSTDEHNLIWEKTGEEINYLWGMSHTAETLLHDYIRTEISPDLSFFHLLRPVYDLPMFGLLTEAGEAVWDTHSCAQVKPWCGRCPKCLYVFIHYLAWLPEQPVLELFERNPFAYPKNREPLRKMLGLEGFKPCDCVGTVSEARLAYAVCQSKGLGMDGVELDPLEIEPEYLRVWESPGCIPADLFDKIRPHFCHGAQRLETLARTSLT